MRPLTQLGPEVYVSLQGSDSNAGSLKAPFKTIERAVSTAIPGATIYVLSGTYNLDKAIIITSNGTKEKPIKLVALSTTERPVLDFSNVAFKKQGIRLKGSYWHIKGFEIRKAKDNGMQVDGGSNNRIEFCSFYENEDTGLQLFGGAANNEVVNCDSYYNVDLNHGNADGFAVKMDVGTGNKFKGCRAWQNSDDGWDGFLRGTDDITTSFDSCWVIKNGYLKDGTASKGNGNGFKMGGGDKDDTKHNVTLTNCLAAFNREKGFDQNNTRGNVYVYNGTAYGNARNIFLNSKGGLAAGKEMVIKNTVSYNGTRTKDSFWEGAIQENNSWNPGFTVSDKDFISLDSSGLLNPRSSDGSLPVITFLHLPDTSILIDKGTNVGLPFKGKAPDLGCFEFEKITP